jgi:hypothetical protein
MPFGLILTLAVLGSFVLPLIGVVGLALIAFGVWRKFSGVPLV